MTSGVDMQQTIARPAVCAGVGVHSGEKAKLVLKPAAAGTGIIFVRTDISGQDNRIPAHADLVSNTQLCTMLTNDAGVSIAVVEHLMAALAGLGIDNLIVEIDGPEVPIMDGSASVYCELLRQAGLEVQSAPRRRIRILERVEINDGPRKGSLSPSESNHLTLWGRIEFDNALIGVQEMTVDMEPGVFARDLAFARTFGFARDIEMLQAMGRARGGSLENAVVVGEDGTVMNPEGLRADDEFIRHKLLDAVGDLMLAGSSLAGRYEAVQPGHALNYMLVRKLLDTPSAWCWETDEETVRPAVDTARVSA